MPLEKVTILLEKRAGRVKELISKVTELDKKFINDVVQSQRELVGNYEGTGLN